MIKRLLRKIRLHFESKRNWKMKMDVPLTIVARNGKPIAEMKAVSTKPISNRIGIAKNKIHVPDNFEETNDEIATMLMEGEL